MAILQVNLGWLLISLFSAYVALRRNGGKFGINVVFAFFFNIFYLISALFMYYYESKDKKTINKNGMIKKVYNKLDSLSEINFNSKTKN